MSKKWRNRGRQGPTTPAPTINEGASYWESEEDRHNRLCEMAQRMGICVPTGPLEPPELDADGSDPEPMDE